VRASSNGPLLFVSPGEYLLTCKQPTHSHYNSMLSLISSARFDQIMITPPEWMLVEITTAWLGTTKIMRPVLVEVLTHCRETVSSYTLHAKPQDEWAIKMGVSGFPVYVLWYAGQERQRWVGIQPKDTWQRELYHWLGKK